MNIDSQYSLHDAVCRYGVLPFFPSPVAGLSVAEMAVPGALFGSLDDDADGSVEGYGCWDWKGPVIQQMDVAYGKFFRRKAGFVALDILPDFLNFRRALYPVREGSTEADILEIIREAEGMTSTELRRLIKSASSRGAEGRPQSRHSLEGPLQRLQMGGWLMIADFEYKYTRLGERYGWGVALYTAPEIWFGREVAEVCKSPADSLDAVADRIRSSVPGVTDAALKKLLL